MCLAHLHCDLPAIIMGLRVYLQPIYVMFDGITSTVVESDPSMKSRRGMAAGACNPPCQSGHGA